MSNQEKNLKYYLDLPYTEVLRRDDEGDFIARVDELQGCVAHGATRVEALEHLQIMQELWITDALENQDVIPEPYGE